MDAGIGRVRGACYGEDMGEAHANSVTASERPRRCCRIDTSEPMHVTTAAAALVAAVEGARTHGAPLLSGPRRPREGWPELGRAPPRGDKAAGGPRSGATGVPHAPRAPRNGR